MIARGTHQVQVATPDEARPGQGFERVAFFDENGDPVDVGGGGGETTPPTWTQITGKPATFPPAIGTTATTAMAGNTPIPAAPTWANISGKPAVVAAGADQAAARSAIGAGTSSQNLATGTAAQLEAGTDTTARAWTAQAIHAEITRQIAEVTP